MCGIVGYVGRRSCKSIVFDGLKNLEYRGYDSSGIAVFEGKKISIVKAEGKLFKLGALVDSLPEDASIGMGHTRWATHGRPNTVNAHPHGDSECAIVHNGILDNYKELKISLLESGFKFNSDTDSEVIAHLITRELRVTPDLKKAVLNVISLVRGVFALGIMSVVEPDKIYLAKQGSPLVVGLGEGESFFASDAVSLATHTNRGVFLNDGELASLSASGVEIYDFHGKPLEADVKNFDISNESAGKGDYQHYMLKEIYEQPSIARSTLGSYGTEAGFSAYNDGLKARGMDFDRVNKILITGCGTAYHAGWVGKYILGSLSNLPVVLELASEFRYSPQRVDEQTLVIAMSQSGETADTLACVKFAKECGAQVIGICNVPFPPSFALVILRSS